jgi:NTP pyrophosphatase (non-canonical NTP hydrolase)
MSLAAHTTATNHGFTGMDINTQLLRIHSEVSEASEAVRDGKLPSKKIPDFSALEEELADAVIRIMDLGYKHNLYIGHALAAKMWYNQNRPHLHGRANQ